jgi:V/A-type H+-transporting ATPase subunit I
MTLRVRSAAWMQAAVPRASLARALTVLGATGMAEFDGPGGRGQPVDLSGLERRLERYHRLREALAGAWPRPEPVRIEEDMLLEERLSRALDRVEAWGAEAGPLLRAIERLSRVRDDLATLGAFISALEGDARLDLRRLAHLDDPLEAEVFVLASDAPMPDVDPGVLARSVGTREELFLLCVAEAGRLATLETELAAAGARPVRIPRWLPSGVGAAGERIVARVAEADRRLERLRADLAHAGERHRISEVAGELDSLDWIVTHLASQETSRHLAWITGWTTDPTGETLEAALREADIPGVVEITEPPSDKAPPSVLRNPRWARPFELFVKLLGVPGRGETDPTGVVAVAAPLMFGYMFGDVGQGAVLAILGALLRKKLPALGLLLPGGIAAMVFGILFGHVFAMEGIVPALWLHPIDEPLAVLVPPMVFGAALILLGLLLNAVSSGWQGQLARWARAEAGFLLFYVGALGTVFWTPMAVLALAGGLWFVAGEALGPPGAPRRRSPLVALPGAIGTFAEEALRAVVNTISFVRVGAFALAHSGLALAVVTLAEPANPIGAAVILIVGNIAIIALEGLVVSVQTSRLILFEFFIRFLRAGGRVFSPTVPPACVAPGTDRG